MTPTAFSNSLRANYCAFAHVFLASSHFMPAFSQSALFLGASAASVGATKEIARPNATIIVTRLFMGDLRGDFAGNRQPHPKTNPWLGIGHFDDFLGVVFCGFGGAGFAIFLSRSSKAASLSSQPSSRALFIKAPDIAVIVLCRHPLGWEPRSSTLAAASS